MTSALCSVVPREVLSCDVAIWLNFGNFGIDILPSYLGPVPAGRTSIRHFAVHHLQDRTTTVRP